MTKEKLCLPKGYCNKCGKLECKCNKQNSLLDTAITTAIAILGAIK